MDPTLAPFPIISQPSVPQDPLKAALLRQKALMAMQQTANASGKGDLLSATPQGSQEIAGIVNPPDAQPQNGPRVGVMPPLQTDSPAVAPVSDQPSDQSTPESKGPTDLTKLGSTSSTPVAAAADPLEKELGGDPQEKKPGTFWDNPASSEALIAFGSAMLKAPNFNTGLANGAEAVSKALEPYKMPSRADVARATLAARLKRYASGEVEKSKGYSSPNVGYDAQGRTVVGVLNKDTGMEWTWGDGTKHPTPPPDFRMHQDSGLGKQAELAQKANDEAIGIAGDVPATLADIDALQHSFKPAGGGAGLIAQSKQYFDNLVGADIFGDLGSQQTFDLVSRKIELSMGQTQRGLGQLTEGERQIIRDSLPKLNQDPRAFWRITEMMRAKAERSRDIADSWLNDLTDEERAKFGGNIKRYALTWDKKNDYLGRLKSIRTSELPSYLRDTPAPAAPAAPGAPAAPQAVPGMPTNISKGFY